MNLNETPQQIDVENSSTIEGAIKIFDVIPPQNEGGISIIIEEIKKVKEISPNRYTNAYVTFQYY